ncbi:hypothetical protein JOE48_000222 [Methylobacterium sp. PvR107]|nr:hypothetical protein [Methylobacterium sp. PvR107]
MCLSLSRPERRKPAACGPHPAPTRARPAPPRAGSREASTGSAPRRASPGPGRAAEPAVRGAGDSRSRSRRGRRRSLTGRYVGLGHPTLDRILWSRVGRAGTPACLPLSQPVATRTVAARQIADPLLDARGLGFVDLHRLAGIVGQAAPRRRDGLVAGAVALAVGDRRLLRPLAIPVRRRLLLRYPAGTTRQRRSGMPRRSERVVAQRGDVVAGTWIKFWVRPEPIRSGIPPVTARPAADGPRAAPATFRQELGRTASAFPG